MNKINFQNGILVAKAKVTINGTVYEVEPAEYEGTTPLNAENLNQIQTNAENAINTVQSNLNTTNQNIEDLTTYSTTEKVVGTWIDGKPIYRKVLTLVLTSTSSSGVSQDVTDLNIDAITHIEGISQSDPHSTNYTWDETLDKFRTYYDPNRKEIRAQGGSSYPTLPCTVYVILEYTKTTD